MDGLPSEVKGQIAFLFLDNLVGEDDVERWTGAIDADPEAASGITPDELRDEIRTAGGVVHRRAVGAASRPATGGTIPVLVRLHSSLKRIDHPYASHHLQVVLERGFDAASDTAEREAIDAAEGELAPALAGVAVEAAHITDRRRRVTHFVCEDGDRALEIAQAVGGSLPPLGIEGDGRVRSRLGVPPLVRRLTAPQGQ